MSHNDQVHTVRVKRLLGRNRSGYMEVEYHEEDIRTAPWLPALTAIVDLIKSESPDGWFSLMYDFIGPYRNSALYPIIESFEDHEAEYSQGNKQSTFHPQTEALVSHFGRDGGTKSGKQYWSETELEDRVGGHVTIYQDQMNRIEAYSTEEMLDMLARLWTLGGAFPRQRWWYSMEYGKSVALFCNDYPEYLKTVFFIPPGWYYVRRTGCKSWLELLDMAGLLQGGVLRTTRGHRCIAKDGDTCNSLAELEIDNWMTARGIPHQREPHYPFHPVVNPLRALRADFAVGETMIEYAGLMQDREYAERIERKRQMCKELGIELIIVTPRDLKGLRVLDRLVKNGDQVFQ